MIEYLLDSNTITFWLSRPKPHVVRMAGLHRRSLAISAVVMHELYFGALAGSRSRDMIELYRSTGLPVLPFDDRDARIAAEIRVALKNIGTPIGIGPYDILIAGQALARDLTVVTNNVREFARIDGLRLADWTQP